MAWTTLSKLELITLEESFPSENIKKHETMTNIKLFQDKRIRSSWNDEEEQWYFSIVDVVEALTDSPNPRQYWRKMKDRDLKEFETYPFWVQLKLLSPDGKMRATDD